MTALHQNTELRRDAQILLFHHGEEAGSVALQRAQSMRDQGDMDAQIYWLRVRDLVSGLIVSIRRPPSTARH